MFQSKAREVDRLAKEYLRNGASHSKIMRIKAARKMLDVGLKEAKVWVERHFDENGCGEPKRLRAALPHFQYCSPHRLLEPALCMRTRLDLNIEIEHFYLARVRLLTSSHSWWALEVTLFNHRISIHS